MRVHGVTISREEFDLPYPRHPGLCDPETVCVCGDALSEHVRAHPEWLAIDRPVRIEPIHQDVLTLHRRDGAGYFHVAVMGRADGSDFTGCMGRWADQRCMCRTFVEATPEQIDFVTRRRAADYIGLGERRAQLYRDTFAAIYRACASSGDDLLLTRARRLGEKHGFAIPTD